MRKVIHLIPYDGIGGVEVAARTTSSLDTIEFSFRVETILPPSAAQDTWLRLNPVSYARALLRLWRMNPDVLIVSLWRSYAVGILLKLLRPGTGLVVFLHLPNDVHAADRLLTRLASLLACRIWADSHETLSKRLPSMPSRKGRVISFVTSRIVVGAEKTVRPVFVFWGRIHTQKGLLRALRIFTSVHDIIPSARFLVIGPDGGDLARVKALARDAQLEDAVRFTGALAFDQIRDLADDAAFYLQTSELEGMAMSVVEAMQLGLVPVVTAVGEIAHYARHGENAVLVEDDAQAVTDILNLLSDDDRYQAMRSQAISTWHDQPLYKSSVMSACREVLGLVDDSSGGGVETR